MHKSLQRIISLTLILGLLVGCSTLAATPTRRADGLSHEQAATLSSLKKVDGYPLYTMHYYGAYDQMTSSAEMASAPAWACSLFAALGDADNTLYGRNFDWYYSPALLLFTDPPDGFASVSMVDITYLAFEETKASTIADLPLTELRPLLHTPFWPFDGLNERGLAVGMAAVPPGNMRPEPNKGTIGSLNVIRQMLDHAGNVDEALAILKSYNIDFKGGPPIHYLIADSSGRSLLVEFYQGEMVILPNETHWLQATNFLLASAGDSANGRCWRYDKISQRLTEAKGQLAAPDAMNLLSGVAQGGTQWSVVYGMNTGDVNVVMGQQYDNVHTFRLRLASE